VTCKALPHAAAPLVWLCFTAGRQRTTMTCQVRTRACIVVAALLNVDACAYTSTQHKPCDGAGCMHLWPALPVTFRMQPTAPAPRPTPTQSPSG
jgi:hypothetical protein